MGTGGWGRERLALLGFVVLAALAVGLSSWAGRFSWFGVDDWDFLTRQDTLADFFRSHHGHWTTLPLVAYRGLYAIDGLHHYGLYQGVAIVSHVAVAALLRVVMRRSGVDPWIATLAAAVYLFFGAGRDDMVNAFQITFTWALAFGLAQLILTGHDGPVDRRDWWALAAGAAALACSGVGLALLVAVALATFLRRGWRPALLQIVPLIGLQIAWVLITGTGSPSKAGRPASGVWVRWVWDSVAGTFVGLGHLPVGALALGGLLVVGLTLAWGPLPRAEVRRRAAAPLALLIGGVAFFVSTGYGRWSAATTVRAERYMDIGAACALPALAVAVDAIARRWRVGAPVAVGLLLLGVPWNIASMAPTGMEQTWFSTPKRVLLGAPRSPLAEEVPSDVAPLGDRWANRETTIGWLLAAQEAGKLPDPPNLSVRDENEIEVRLAISQSNEQAPDRCRTETGPTVLTTTRGETVTSSTTLAISKMDGQIAVPPPMVFDPSHGSLLTFEVDGLSLYLDPRSPDATIAICR